MPWLGSRKHGRITFVKIYCAAPLRTMHFTLCKLQPNQKKKKFQQKPSIFCIALVQQQASFFWKGPESKYFRLCGHMITATTIQLYHSIVKVTRQYGISKAVFQQKLFTKQVASWIWSTSCPLLSSGQANKKLIFKINLNMLYCSFLYIDRHDNY